MKRATFISIMLIILGFIFEWIHLATDIQLLEIKFWILGVICIIAGTLGLWIYTILPAFNDKTKK